MVTVKKEALTALAFTARPRPSGVYQALFPTGGPNDNHSNWTSQDSRLVNLFMGSLCVNSSMTAYLLLTE